MKFASDILTVTLPIHIEIQYCSVATRLELPVPPRGLCESDLTRTEWPEREARRFVCD